MLKSSRVANLIMVVPNKPKIRYPTLFWLQLGLQKSRKMLSKFRYTTRDDRVQL